MSWSFFLMGEVSLCYLGLFEGRLTNDLILHRIRNYIGKEWFLDLALKGEPSSLSQQMKDILGPKKDLPSSMLSDLKL
jgi:hypothetical protein